MGGGGVSVCVMERSEGREGGREGERTNVIYIIIPIITQYVLL